MTVIDEKPVPIYVQECQECGSTFTFKKAEVLFNLISCPVCGISQWASFQEKIKEENGIVLIPSKRRIKKGKLK